MLSWRVQQVIRNIKEKLLVVKDKAIFLAKSKYTWATAFFILLFTSGLYLNSYTGRIVELQKKAEQQFSTCEKNLMSCEKNATVNQEQFTTCSADLAKTQLNLTACTSDRQQLEKQYKNISLDLLTCQKDYSSLNATYQDLKINYDLLAKNAATNICCKRKLDDPSLKYYYIDGNSIVCTAIASDRTKEFSCPSLT
jgi:chromosome segregation ATPase